MNAADTLDDLVCHKQVKVFSNCCNVSSFSDIPYSVADFGEKSSLGH